MPTNALVEDAFEKNLAEMLAKADAYRRLGALALESVQDRSMAARAEESAKAYEGAAYEKAKWNARNMAIARGYPAIADRILHGMEVTIQPDLPPELERAICQWRSLVRVRPWRELFL